METLNHEKAKCFEEQFYGPEKCKHIKGTLRFIEKYNCTLPWMSAYEFGNQTLCESNSVPDMSLHGLIFEAINLKSVANCENYLPCKRTIYQDVLQQKLMTYIDGDVIEKATLNIEYSSPYIQVIKDSWSYDMQSYIGEVGGTLGLLLGLSFASIFDLFEHLLNKFFKH